MPLQTSGPISLANIQTEFGGTNPASLSEYLAGGAYVSSGTAGVNGAIPANYPISFSKFLGATSRAWAATSSLAAIMANASQNSVVYNGSMFVSAGATGKSSRSQDGGKTWMTATNLQDVVASRTVNKLAANGNTVVAACAKSTIARSTDGGLAWTSIMFGGLDSPDLLSAAWAGTQFLVAGVNNYLWVVDSNGGVGSISSVQISGATIVAIASKSSEAILVDGAGYAYRIPLPVSYGTTIASTAYVGFPCASAAWGASKYVCGGTLGRIASSADGVVWTTRYNSGTGTVNSIVWDGTKFVAVTTDRKLLTSSDGITWVADANFSAAYPSSSEPRSVAVGGNSIVVVGTQAACATY